MKQGMGWSRWIGMGAVAVVALSGCTPQEEAAVDEGAADTTQAMDNAADTTADAAGNVADAAGNVADATGNAATNASEFATITPNIKEALGDNKALEGSSIDVDTDVTNNVVHLKGTVKDAGQKTLAESIAKAELAKLQPASKFTVTNELTVGAADAAGAASNSTP